jgi:hypothetical protein
MSFKKFFNNDYIKGIIIGVVVILIVTVFPTIREAAIKGIKWFFSTKIHFPIWLFLFLLPLLYFSVRWLRRNTNKKKQPPPIDHLFENYTSGIFYDKLYKWYWKKLTGGKLDISPLLPHCPECEVSLVRSKCPSCNEQYRFEEDEDAKVLALILAKVQKGEYPT